MADRDGYWPGRRVLVLGCSGFVGTWLVRGLLARGAEVVGLVRDPDRDSDFFRDKLYRHVHVVRGRADDLPRLRSLIGVYEIQIVFQFAAGPSGSNETATRVALAAAGRVPVVVPVPPGKVLGTPSARLPGGLTLVKLPTLFGGGDRRWDRWPPRLLLAAARGEPLPVPPVEAAGAPVGSAREAVAGLLNSLPEATGTEYRTVSVPPQGTAADLYAAVARLGQPPLRLHDAGAARPEHPIADAAREAVEWYRTAVPPAEPADRRAAA